ncbi:MAG TPA: ABC transporter permease subunit [Tepidisphaeraceae bacterium]|jgi:ABC-type transport system involved in multi-copper enzyme maturation permease subunit
MRIPRIHHLSDISPFGPIFGKELRITARRKRNHLLRVVYLGGLLLFLLMVWAGNEMPFNNAGQGVAFRIQQQNRLGQEFFATFSLFCAAAMGLISPVLTSTAISSERLGKTLPVLLMTPITSWQIVCGKLFSRLLISLMLIGLSLPVLAVVRLLGGVELSQMAAVVLTCTAFALSAAAIGLFFSTLLNRAYAVILLSYATMLVLYVFAPMFLVMISPPRSGPTFWIFQCIAATNPPFTVAVSSMPDVPTALIPEWWPCVVIQLGFAAALVTASAALLRWFARREGQRAIAQPAAGFEVPQTPSQAAQQTDQVVEHVTRSHRKGWAEVGRNPVLWRELRRPLMGKRWSWVAGALVVGLLLLSYVSFASVNALDDHETQIFYACVLHGLWWLLVAVLSATAIVQEKESDTWTVLLAAPLSASSIVLGKLMGLSRRMMWPTLLIAFHFVVFAVAGIVSWPVFFVIFWVLITFNTVWAALGIYLSLRLKKATTAVIINLIVPVVLFLAVPVVLLVLGELLERSDKWAEVVTWYLPYYYLSQSIEKLCPHFSWNASMWMPGFGSGTTGDFFQVLIIAGLFHLMIAGLIVVYTVRHFDQFVGRATQVGGRLTPAAAIS